MKKCTQCGQSLSDETNFCHKCGGSSFEPITETGAGQPAYQQQSYQPPVQQVFYQTPQSYQQDSEPVSVGMNLLFLILMNIPLVNLIYAIVVAASSRKKSYKNLAIAWFIYLAIGIVLALIFWSLIANVVGDIFSGYYY